MTGGQSRVRVAIGYGEQRTYASYLNTEELEQTWKEAKWKLVERFPVEGDVWSFLLTRERDGVRQPASATN